MAFRINTQSDYQLQPTTSIWIRLVRISMVVVIGLVLTCASGCEQRRYQPSKYRPAANTLPKPSLVSTVNVNRTAGDTLVMRGSLPYRGSLAVRGSLPYRAGSLPIRGVTTLASRGTLPGRITVTGPKIIWDTSPKEEMPQRRPTTPIWYDSGPSGTLPARGTLPGRVGAQSLPLRPTSRLAPTTLPLRENRGIVPDHLLPQSPLRGGRLNTTLPDRFRRPTIPRGSLPARRPLR